MPDLIPVEDNPFNVNLVPVDNDPWAAARRCRRGHSAAKCY